MPIEQIDQCVRAEQLRGVRDALISGQATAEYESDSGNGVKRRVKYSNADLPRLEIEIRRAEEACDLTTGAGKPRRRMTRGVLRG
jgi:hypothetical protein